MSHISSEDYFDATQTHAPPTGHAKYLGARFKLWMPRSRKCHLLYGSESSFCLQFPVLIPVRRVERVSCIAGYLDA